MRNPEDETAGSLGLGDPHFRKLYNRVGNRYNALAVQRVHSQQTHPHASPPNLLPLRLLTLFLYSCSLSYSLHSV